MATVTLIGHKIYRINHHDGEQTAEIDLSTACLQGYSVEDVIKARAAWKMTQTEIQYLASLIRNDVKQWRRKVRCSTVSSG
jgi:hypothetical protein